jgi:transcriptional regulator with XRE-family HTH domain
MNKHYKVTEEFRQFCKSLFDSRFRAGTSQANVAKAIKVDQATVSRIERGAFGDVISEAVYAHVSAYAKAYGLSAPVLEGGAKAARGPAARVAPKASAATPRTGSVKHDATATILRLVADGTIPPEVAGIVIKALAS